MYQVESILDKRINPQTGQTQYKVKWLGYPLGDCTWEPLEHLEHVTAEVDKLQQELRRRNPSKQVDVSEVSQKKRRILCHSERVRNRQPRRDSSSQQSLQQNPSSSEKQSVSRQRSRGKARKGNMESSKSAKKGRPAAKKVGLRSDGMQQVKGTQLKYQPKASEQPQVKASSIRKRRGQVKVGKQQQKPKLNEPSLSGGQQKSQPIHLEEEIVKTEDVLDINDDQEQLLRQDENFVIKQCSKSNQNMIYRAQDQGESKWFTRNEIMRRHPQALIRFYESFINLVPVRKLQPKQQRARQ